MRSTDCRADEVLSQPGVEAGGSCHEASAEPDIRMTRIGARNIQTQARPTQLNESGSWRWMVVGGVGSIANNCCDPEQHSTGQQGQIGLSSL